MYVSIISVKGERQTLFSLDIIDKRFDVVLFLYSTALKVVFDSSSNKDLLLYYGVWICY